MNARVYVLDDYRRDVDTGKTRLDIIDDFLEELQATHTQLVENARMERDIQTHFTRIGRDLDDLGSSA